MLGAEVLEQPLDVSLDAPNPLRVEVSHHDSSQALAYEQVAETPKEEKGGLGLAVVDRGQALPEVGRYQVFCARGEPTPTSGMIPP